MPAADATDDEKARLVVGSCRRFDERLIEPKRLGFDEINPVFGFVGRVLLRIELKLHFPIIG
jgi:hypothetical protein